MKAQKAKKVSRAEQERYDDIAGYDRNFDPIQEARDLKIAQRHINRMKRKADH